MTAWAAFGTGVVVGVVAWHVTVAWLMRDRRDA